MADAIVWPCSDRRNFSHWVGHDPVSIGPRHGGSRRTSNPAGFYPVLWDAGPELILYRRQINTAQIQVLHERKKSYRIQERG
jgi:hypothetical protein